jgi:hypothetical protein
VDAGVLGEERRLLAGQDDRGEGELGHRDGVVVGGVGDEDLPPPDLVGDERADGAGAVEDGPQQRRVGQSLGREPGNAPRGDQHFDLAQPAADVGRVEVVGDDRFGELDELVQPA